MVTVTVTEASNIIGVRRQHIRELIRKGTLPAHKEGGRWQIELAAVNQYDRAREYAKNPRLIDAAEAAELAGVNKAVVLRWARTGKLPIAAQRRIISETHGRPRYLFRREDLEQVTTASNRYDPHTGAA